MSMVFRLGRKMVKSTTRAYLCLNPCDQRIRNKTMTKICNWVRRLTGPRKFVPKGHVAVYVGQKYEDLHRYLVPVICFNHPLFGELLREVEEEYGFYHPGEITIPCRISEFERVQMRIAGESGRKMIRRVWSS